MDCFHFDFDISLTTSTYTMPTKSKFTKVNLLTVEEIVTERT